MAFSGISYPPPIESLAIFNPSVFPNIGDISINSGSIITPSGQYLTYEDALLYFLTYPKAQEESPEDITNLKTSNLTVATTASIPSITTVQSITFSDNTTQITAATSSGTTSAFTCSFYN